MKKNNNLYNYPSKEEYIRKVHKIQEEELKSQRFKRVSEELSNNYWNRGGIELEKQLFEIVETPGMPEKLINKSDDYKRVYIFNKYLKLKQFMNYLSGEEINSNIFLKRAKEYMDLSLKDCMIVFDELKCQMTNIKNDEENRILQIECEMPKSREEIIPLRIMEQKDIKYYRPQDHQISYINILPSDKKYIYKDYNEYVGRLNELAENIYMLQMNMIINMCSEEVFNYKFKINESMLKHKQFIASFTLKGRKRSITDESLKSENKSYYLTLKRKK